MILCFLANQTRNSVNAFLLLAKRICLPIKQEKTVLPSTCVQLHCLELCTEKMEVRLPHDKTQKALMLIDKYCKHRTITLKELQSVMGTLSFATKAVVAGRTFLRCLIDLTKGVTKKSHHINLNSQARLDLKCWREFLVNFNGKRLLSRQVWNSAADLKFSDASGMGYAAIVGHKWIQGSFPES